MGRVNSKTSNSLLLTRVCFPLFAAHGCVVCAQYADNQALEGKSGEADSPVLTPIPPHANLTRAGRAAVAARCNLAVLRYIKVGCAPACVHVCVDIWMVALLPVVSRDVLI